MKGNDKVIATLNNLLADELAAINQYMVQASICDIWGYGKLHALFETHAKVEMHHAEKLIDRIVFLEGIPIVSKLGPIRIGEQVPAMLENDRSAEAIAIVGYNDGVKTCVTAGDDGTREILECVLREEEGHLEDVEGQLTQVKQMGLQNYLGAQVV